MNHPKKKQVLPGQPVWLLNPDPSRYDVQYFLTTFRGCLAKHSAGRSQGDALRICG